MANKWLFNEKSRDKESKFDCVTFKEMRHEKVVVVVVVDNGHLRLALMVIIIGFRYFKCVKSFFTLSAFLTVSVKTLN